MPCFLDLLRTGVALRTCSDVPPHGQDQSTETDRRPKTCRWFGLLTGACHERASYDEVAQKRPVPPGPSAASPFSCKRPPEDSALNRPGGRRQRRAAIAEGPSDCL